MVAGLSPLRPQIRARKNQRRAVTKAYLESRGTDPKPDIGERMLACPYCGMESLYRRFHLTCEDDSDKDAKGKGA
jgi:hypothetical protein